MSWTAFWCAQGPAIPDLLYDRRGAGGATTNHTGGYDMTQESPRREGRQSARAVGRVGGALVSALLAAAFAMTPVASADWTGPGTMTNPLEFGGDSTIFTSTSSTLLSHVTVADLNGDNKPDVVALDYGNGTADVIPNPNGTTSFAANVPVGSGPSDLVVADVNGDSHPDLVTVTGGNTVSVMLNNGDGTFGTTPTTYDVGYGTTGLAVVDVNGDSKPDIVVGDQSNLIVVLLNNGDGTFTEENTVYSTGTITPGDLVVGDFNHDGNPDIAWTNYATTGTVSIMYGDGNGGFGTPQTYPAGDHPTGLAVGDFNGDGYPDLALVDYPSFATGGTDTVDVMLNNGSASTGLSDQFASPTAVATLPNQSPEGAPFVRTGDLNFDGNSDLAVYDGNDTYVYTGNGDGTFDTTAHAIFNGPVTDFAIADLNGDTAPDFVVSTVTNPGTIAVNWHVVPPTNATAPTLPMKALVNETLNGDPGTWNSFSPPFYSWVLQQCNQSGQNCIDDPSGESGTGTPYATPNPDDAGSTVRVAVSAGNTAGYSDPVYSNVTNVVPTPPENLSAPTITGETTPGSASVGQTLTVGGDTWNMHVTRSYNWWVCPPGDTDPSAWQTNCYFPFARSQKIAVSSRWVGFKVEAVVAGFNFDYGRTYANTGLVSVLAITPNAVRAATFDQGYKTTLKAFGGSAPWTWSLASGNLPPHMSLDAATGAISGKPSATGIYTFTVQASDSSSPALVATHTYSLMVGPAIAPASLSDATVNQSYNADLTANGGTSPYTWSLAPGSSLPDGLSLDPSAGTISGTPTTAGTYTFTVQVTDSSSPAVTGSRKYTLNVS